MTSLHETSFSPAIIAGLRRLGVTTTVQLMDMDCVKIRRELPGHYKTISWWITDNLFGPTVKISVARKKRVKLTDAQVCLIRKLHGKGARGKDIAEEFNIRASTVSRIVNWQAHKDLV